MPLISRNLRVGVNISTIISKGGEFINKVANSVTIKLIFRLSEQKGSAYLASTEFIHLWL